MSLLKKITAVKIYIFAVIFSIVFLGTAAINYYKNFPSVYLSVSDVTDNFFYNASGGKTLVRTYIKSHSATSGTTYHLSTVLPSNLSDDYAIQFYTHNSWVTVYVNDTVIHKISPENFVGLSKSPGSFWNIVSIPSWAYDKTLTIEITPIYSFHTSLIKKIYAGDQYDLNRLFIRDRIIPLSVCFFNILLAFTFLIIGIIARLKKSCHSLFFLGLIGIFISIYSICETNILSFIYPNTRLLTTIQTLALAAIPFPAIRYSMIENKTLPSARTRILEALPTLNFIFILILQLTAFADPNISNICTYVTILIVFIFIFLYSRQRFIQNRLLHTESNLGIIGAWIFMVCIFIDSIRYSIDCTADSTLFTRISLFLFLILNTYKYGIYAIELMNIGLHSESLKQTAYLDSLTGLGNRTLLNMDMDNLKDNLPRNASIGIVQLDINYLKRVNDSLGHLAGDRLIQNAATAISSAFSDYGKCYRFGGDEFMVILIGNAHEKYGFGIQTLERYLEQLNNTLPKDEQVSIAYGASYYDSNTDINLWKVQEQADVNMYEQKRKFKEKLVTRYIDSRL